MEEENNNKNKQDDNTANADDLRKQLESTQKEATAIADAVLSTIPERLKALVPEGLTPTQKAQWAIKAQALGVFGPNVPETDGGRKPTVTPKNPDVSSLPPIARMAHGYSRK
jgi:hypothetical protein